MSTSNYQGFGVSAGILSAKLQNNSTYYDPIHITLGEINPNTNYQLTFKARGTGKLETFIYPGAFPQENGGGGDGKHSYQLTDDWKEYQVQLISLATLYGDSNKSFLFRFEDKNMDVEIDLNSLTLIEVGG